MPGNTDYLNLIKSQKLFKEENPASYYDIIKQIGSGGYGKIYLVQRKQDESKFALKFI